MNGNTRTLTRHLRPAWLQGLGLIMVLGLSQAAAAKSVGTAYEYDAEAAETLAVTTAYGLSSADRQTLLNLINRARATAHSCGGRRYAATGPVAWDDRLEQAAQNYSDTMAQSGFFSHTGRDGSTPGSRVTAAGYGWSYVSENIAAGYATPQAVIDGWLKSAGHCANLMSSRAKHIGLGRATSSNSRYGVYWTLNLAAPR
jgi:uncharacterized protein YkwD